MTVKESSSSVEVNSIPEILQPDTNYPVISAPSFQLSFPKSSLAWRINPLDSPMWRVFSSMHTYLEEVGHLTKLNPQEDWLPITESRKGNAYYAAFHTLSSGIGVQALVLPLAFVALGWSWGIISLTLAFMWQFYTLWLLIQLHESSSGTRYSRYLHLAKAAFGEKLGKLLALFPTMYLSGGTCVLLIMIGGGTMKIFFRLVCVPQTCSLDPLTTVEWYLVFTCCAVVLAQFPNLNSIAGVSLIGSITAVAYCTLIWVVSVAKDRPSDISYGPIEPKSEMDTFASVLNGLGIIAFAFRGHNLVLEIQGTMPTSLNHPSSIPMWRGVKFSYVIIALCLFPLAIGGFWAYGNLIPSNGGLLTALNKYHKMDTPKFVLGFASLLVVVNCLTSFQIYAMPVFDNLEFKYTSNTKKPCPLWLRTLFRIFFGCFVFFISVALPFLPSLAGLIGGIALPLTLAYPCFMWIMIKRPQKYTLMWCINWFLGCLGMILSIMLVFGAIWNIVNQGIEVHFFKPK